MAAPSITDPAIDPDAPLRLHFAAGKLGCMLPVMAIAILFFAHAAVTPGGLEAEGRRAGIIAIANGMQFAGVSIPFLLIAIGLLWEFVRMGRRWADGVAVTAGEHGLRFHPTLLRRPVAWHELRDIRVEQRRIHLSSVDEIVFDLGSRVVRLRGFDDEGGAGGRFVAAVGDRRNRGAERAA